MTLEHRLTIGHVKRHVPPASNLGAELLDGATLGPFTFAASEARGRWQIRVTSTESIGLLTQPPPPVAELEADLVRLWRFLVDLDADETRFGQAREADRPDVVDAVASLPGSAHTPEILWSR